MTIAKVELGEASDSSFWIVVRHRFRQLLYTSQRNPASHSKIIQNVEINDSDERDEEEMVRQRDALSSYRRLHLSAIEEKSPGARSYKCTFPQRCLVSHRIRLRLERHADLRDPMFLLGVQIRDHLLQPTVHRRSSVLLPKASRRCLESSSF